MSHKMYFVVKIREPYMGNDVPLKIEVTLYEDTLTIKVIDPEGISHTANEIDKQAFNE